MARRPPAGKRAVFLRQRQGGSAWWESARKTIAETSASLQGGLHLSLRVAMLIGPARVSKSDGTQTLDPRRDAMPVAGVDPSRIYEETLLQIGQHPVEAFEAGFEIGANRSTSALPRRSSFAS
jgi:hypothetical protein